MQAESTESPIDDIENNPGYQMFQRIREAEEILQFTMFADKCDLVLRDAQIVRELAPLERRQVQEALRWAESLRNALAHNRSIRTEIGKLPEFVSGVQRIESVIRCLVAAQPFQDDSQG